MSRILIEQGAVALVVATISPANNREQQERRIADQLAALLRDTPDPSVQQTIESNKKDGWLTNLRLY